MTLVNEGKSESKTATDLGISERFFYHKLEQDKVVRGVTTGRTTAESKWPDPEN